MKGKYVEFPSVEEIKSDLSFRELKTHDKLQVHAKSWGWVYANKKMRGNRSSNNGTLVQLLVYTCNHFLPGWFVPMVTVCKWSLEGTCYSHQEGNLYHFLTHMISRWDHEKLEMPDIWFISTEFQRFVFKVGAEIILLLEKKLRWSYLKQWKELFSNDLKLILPKVKPSANSKLQCETQLWELLWHHQEADFGALRFLVLT